MHLNTLCAVMKLACGVSSSLYVNRDSDASAKTWFSGKRMEALPECVRK